MNAYELNKILGAILGALVFVMGLSVLSDIIFSEKPPETPGYQVAIADPEEEAAAEEEAAEEEAPFEVLLASADPAAGEAGSRVCGACHSFEEGGANGIGPALWNVVGREVAGVADFNYSSALTEHGEEVETWTYAELDGFLENPQGWVPGTSMSYAGIKDREDRADVIAYLKSVSPDAPPLPEAPEAEMPVNAAGGDVDAEATAEVAEEEAAEETDVAAVGDAATATDAAPAADEAAPADEAAEAAPAQDGEGSFAQLVASSDPAAGQAASAVCQACHTVAEGEPHRIGPNLHGVFDRQIASAEGFQYSSAMQTYAEDEGAWTVANLDPYLEAPMEVVPGTTMSYAGVKDQEQRAQIIAWLHSISPDAGPVVPEGDAAAETAATPAADTARDDGAAAPQGEADAPAGNAAEATDEAEEAAAPASDDATRDAAGLVTEEGETEGVAGHDTAAAGDEAVEDVAEAAAGEIAEGGVDAPAEAAAQDAQTTASADGAVDSTVAADEAEREDVADPVRTGAGTEAAAEDVDPAPAAAALDEPSGAVVPDATREAFREEDRQMDVDVETGLEAEEMAPPEEAGPAPEGDAPAIVEPDIVDPEIVQPELTTPEDGGTEDAAAAGGGGDTSTME